MSRIKTLINKVLGQDRLNFWLTNRIPRHRLTRFIGWFSRIEHPWVARISITVWQWFADDLRLHEARKSTFTSLHDCFIRELKPGVRSVDMTEHLITSPCDAVVGALGRIQDMQLIQAKGMSYSLEELLADPELARRYRGGTFVTLRLKSSMYHRFHAPCECRVREVNYIAGDVWNVNPATVSRVDKLFCRNERAVIPLDLPDLGQSITLVPVAAVLVASIRLNFLDVLLNLKYAGPNRIPCEASFGKGEEMGYFHHGSTIIALATSAFQVCEELESGQVIRMGEALMWRV